MTRVGSQRQGKKKKNILLGFEVRSAHLQPTGGPRNTLRIRLRAARLFTYFVGRSGAD